MEKLLQTGLDGLVAALSTGPAAAETLGCELCAGSSGCPRGSPSICEPLVLV